MESFFLKKNKKNPEHRNMQYVMNAVVLITGHSVFYVMQQ